MSALTDDNYNKLPDEVKINDNMNIQTNQNQNFDKIKNISELPHKYITQPKSNEFFILTNKLEGICTIVISLLISTGFLAATICIRIFATDYDFGIYIGIVFTSFLFLLILILTIYYIYDVLKYPKGIKITLDVDGIKMMKIYRCQCCRNKEILETGEIKRFDVKTEQIKNNEEIKKLISIIYYDYNNNEKILATKNFDENEANYLIYILNNYLQNNTSNYITPITPYNNY